MQKKSDLAFAGINPAIGHYLRHHLKIKIYLQILVNFRQRDDLIVNTIYININAIHIISTNFMPFIFS